MTAAGAREGAAEPPAEANAAIARPQLLEQRENAFADERQKRVEETFVAEPAVAPQDAAAEADAPAAKLEVSVRTFASEIDPFELGVLDTGHLVLFRNVWRDGQRYVQGALIDREVVRRVGNRVPYRASSVAQRQRISAWRSKAALSIGSPPNASAVSALRPGSSRARCCIARGCRRRSATSSSRSSSTRCRARRARRCSPGSP